MLVTAKDWKKGLLKSCILSFASAVLIFIYFVIRDRGFFTIAADFNSQQITFSMALNHALRSGNPGGWIWNYDLGMSIIQAFGFYAMGSPFFWISALFPADWFPYLAAWIYVIKYTVASVTAYCYVSRFVRKPESAIAGALIYAFSGFQTVNLYFYHFHDMVALFPLLLCGLEEIYRDSSKYLLFVCAVFINCLTNYYFFFQEVVFLIIYVLFRFNGIEWRRWLKLAAECAACGLLGMGIGAFLFFPSVLYIMQSQRLQSIQYLNVFFGDSSWRFSALKGFLFPAEPMNYQNSVLHVDWRSVSCYLPLVGTSLCFAFCKGKAGWLSRLIILLVVISFIPGVSSAFIMFTEHNMRWWYMLVMMMALASARVLDDPEMYPVYRGIIVHSVLAVAIYLLLRFVPWRENVSAYYHKDRLFLGFLISFLGALVTFILVRAGKTRSWHMLLWTCIFSVATSGITLHFYRMTVFEDDNAERLRVGMSLPVLDDQYRYDNNNNLFALPGNGSGTSCFSSTLSSGSREFDRVFDFYQVNHSLFKEKYDGLPELLAGRYAVAQGVREDSIYQMTVNNEVWSVVEKPASPIGYAVDHFITLQSLKTIDPAQRALALLQAAVIYEDDKNKVLPISAEWDASDIDLDRSAEELSEENEKKKVIDFSRDTAGFSCKTAYEKDQLVYFSVPFDQGWKAQIDRQDTDIVNSCGMMLLKVPRGRHQIVFTYETPGYRTGKIISLLSGALLILILMISRKKGKKKAVSV